MSNQIIARYDIADYAQFRAEFDADAEDRGNASLSVLQIWREGTGRVWVLYQVADGKRALERTRDHVADAVSRLPSEVTAAIAEIKETLRRVTVEECEALASETLGLGTAAEVELAVAETFATRLSDILGSDDLTPPPPPPMRRSIT